MLYWNVLEKGVKWSDFPSPLLSFHPENTSSGSGFMSLLFEIHSNSLLNCRFLKKNTRTFNYFWHPCPSVCPHPSILGGWGGSEGLTLDFTVMPPFLWTFATSAPKQVSNSHPIFVGYRLKPRRQLLQTISTRSVDRITSRKKQYHFKRKLSLWFLLSPSSSLPILFSFLFFFPPLYNFPPLPH